MPRQLKWVDHPKVVMFAFPAKWPRRRPGLENEVVGLLEALAVMHRVDVGGPGMSISANSSASRTGLSKIGSGLPSSTILARCVVLARIAASRFMAAPRQVGVL